MGVESDVSGKGAGAESEEEKNLKKEEGKNKPCTWIVKRNQKGVFSIGKIRGFGF